jgi:hypothetical protein
VIVWQRRIFAPCSFARALPGTAPLVSSCAGRGQPSSSAGDGPWAAGREPFYDRGVSARLLCACRLEPVDATPVWFVRLSGMYLPCHQSLSRSHTLVEPWDAAGHGRLPAAPLEDVQALARQVHTHTMP